MPIAAYIASTFCILVHRFTCVMLMGMVDFFDNPFQSLQHSLYIWWFPKIGVPQIIHFSRIFHCKPSIFGIPPFQETSIYIYMHVFMKQKTSTRIKIRHLPHSEETAAELTDLVLNIFKAQRVLKKHVSPQLKDLMAISVYIIRYFLVQSQLTDMNCS